MKTKLCVIDLKVLTESVCGAKSAESPTDQKLIDGVEMAIDRYRADGWHFAIVSNIPDCTSKMKASDVRVDDCVIRGDGYYRVESIDNWDRGKLVFKYDKPLESGDHIEWFELDDEVIYSEISLTHMAEMVTFAADLCGIQEAYFCPDIAGQVMYSLEKGVEYGWRSMAVSAKDFEDMTDLAFQKYRLPGSGMLLYAKSLHIWNLKQCLMIGDCNSAQAAAKAGFKFKSAQEWISG